MPSARGGRGRGLRRQAYTESGDQASRIIGMAGHVCDVRGSPASEQASVHRGFGGGIFRVRDGMKGMKEGSEEREACSQARCEVRGRGRDDGGRESRELGFEKGWDGWACGLRCGKQKAGPGRC